LQLLTKSCGILALSGEAASKTQDVGQGQAEPWSDTTTTTIQPSEDGSGSGSGDWQLTTEEETTGSGNEETTG